MENKNYIYAYYQAMKSGKVIVGEKIMMWYQRIVDGLDKKEFIFDQKKANHVILFMEHFVRHSEGSFGGQLLKLELWQKALLSVVFGIVDKEGNRQFREIVVIVARKSGKAVSLDTEIPTPSGWKMMRDIHENDVVFGKDGKPAKVLYESPIFDKPMYAVTFEDGTVVKASEDHLWTVQSKKSKRALKYKCKGHPGAVKQEYRENDGWYTVSTSELSKNFKHIRKDGKGTEYLYRVPMNAPVEYEEKVLPLDPYTLGVWLGDGSRGEAAITIGDQDVPYIISLLEKEGHTASIHPQRSKSKKITIDATTGGRPNATRNALRELGVFHDKFIPEIYLQGSIQQRMDLLQGLMDTDGYCSSNGECEFCQKSELFADQFRELLASLGMKSSKKEKIVMCNGKECHAFSIKFFTDKTRSCFRLKRKHDRLKDLLSERMKAKSVVDVSPIEREPSKCIMVDNKDHLYLVGRNYTATHNTLLAAGIAAYCAFMDGEYGGKIYFAAPKLEQANLCYDAFYQIIKKDANLSKLSQKRRSDVYIASSNTAAKPLAFSAKKSDGLNVSCGICDEIASWQGEQGIKFYEVLKSSQGARKAPILLSISTAGYVNDGIFDELMKRCTRVIKGDSNEKRLAPFLYTIDDVSKWNDINEIQKASPNLGVSVSVDYMIDEITIAEESLTKKAEALTKYCNIKQNSAAAFLSEQTIAKAYSGVPLRLEDFRNTYAVCGIDLSRTTDLTACTCVIEKDGILNVFCQFFMPAEKLEEAIARDNIPYRVYIQRGFLTLSGDNFVDYHDCYNWLTALLSEYKIYPIKVGYDRYSAQYLIQDLEQTGFQVDDVYQGFNLSPVIKELEGTMKDGKINIGDNDMLKIHLYDSALKVDEETDKVRLIKLNTSSHIDGVAALLDALTVRMKYADEIGQQLKNV